MKNIITTATLLAAGTLAMNAAVTIWEDAPKTASGTNVATWDVSSSGLTWSTTTNLQSVVFTVDFSSLNSSSSYALFSMKDGQYNGLGAVGIKDGNLFLVNWNDANPTKETALSGISASKDLTFVFSRTAASKTNNVVSGGQVTLKVYADGNFDNEVATLTGKDKFLFSNGDTSWKKLNFGGTSETSYTGDVNSVMPANSAASGFSLLGAGYSIGELTTANLKSYYNSAVPEPSAFGLLAGLGALALVGARRRRK